MRCDSTGPAPHRPEAFKLFNYMVLDGCAPRVVLGLALALLMPPAPADGAPRGALVTAHDPQAAETLRDGRVRLGWFFFGSPEARPYGGNALGGATVCDGMAWVDGMVRLWKTAPPRGAVELGSGVEGHRATFMVMVPDTADYHVTLTLGHPTRASGPVHLAPGGGFTGEFRQRRQPVTETRVDTTLAAGQFIDLEFELRPLDGRVAFTLFADDCALFSAVSFALYGPGGATLPNRILDAVPAPLALATPPPDSLERLSNADVQKRLLLISDQLRRVAPADGGFSYEGSWYQNAYPLRTLMAASLAVRPNGSSPDSLVRATLDAFTGTQRADGAFSARYFGPLACLATAPPDSASMNLADVGTMMTTLNIAAGLAGPPGPNGDTALIDPERAARYVAASRRYADAVVLPNQMSDGSFPNLRFEGQNYPHPYSVATATQIANLATLSAVTGEARYRAAALRAARWLAATIQPDGRVQFFPHDSAHPGVKEITEFGDTFYILEALTWAWTVAENEPDRAACHAALDAAVWGERGLYAGRVNGVGWALRNRWSDSKLPGLLYVLCRYRALGGRGAPLDDWINRLTDLFGDARRMKSFGVLVDPTAPGGEYALSAAGFAGVGLAAALDPQLLVPVAAGERR